MKTCADGVRVAYPLFPSGGSGSIPTSALQLWFRPCGFDVAKDLNRLWHSRFPDFGGASARVSYSAEHDGIYYASAIWTNPSSPKLPQLSWLMLKRFAIADDAPLNTASRMMGWMVRDIRTRFPAVTTLVSYSDPDVHQGTIYKAGGWDKGETTERKTEGRKNWHSRERGKTTKNVACEWVTRWTLRLLPSVQASATTPPPAAQS